MARKKTGTVFELASVSSNSKFQKCFWEQEPSLHLVDKNCGWFECSHWHTGNVLVPNFAKKGIHLYFVSE